MGFVRRLGQLFRYRVEGLERIPKAGAAMVYCYHGYIPLDMYFFQEAVWRCTGRLPRVLVADFVFRIPFFSWIVRLGGGVPAGRRAALEQLLRGELVVVAPGGVREGMSSTGQDYAVNWFGRQGFAEMAQAAGAPLIPMCTRNVRELFLVLGGSLPFVLKLYKLTKLPFTPFIGPLLVPLTTLVGPPLEHDPNRTPAQVISLAKAALEALLQRAMGMSGAPLDA
jgi:1-acyl-sn-glycerol-3-phosphate acyltransferase